MQADIKNLTYSDLEQFIIDLGQSKYRTKQVFKWVYDGVDNFEDMTNVSKELKQILVQKFYIGKICIEKKLRSSLDETTKYLLKLEDGSFVESVLMKYHHGWSACISTQVGCAMGCRFCASTKCGKVRNLTCGEMIEQIMCMEREEGIRISNVVMMGIGEPLDNYNNVVKFLENAINPHGLNIGGRHITLSTCGLADKIRELADRRLQISLSISLHAVDDETRSGIMPINKKYNINELLSACKYYLKRTNRRISFEYTLIDGVNDSIETGKKLGDLLQGINCYVNLIPVNSVEGAGYLKSKREQIDKFAIAVESRGVRVTVRRSLGGDIDAACGQLRLNESIRLKK